MNDPGFTAHFAFKKLREPPTGLKAIFARLIDNFSKHMVINLSIFIIDIMLQFNILCTLEDALSVPCSMGFSY